MTGLVDADLLILLSDVDGVYDADPRTRPDAELIQVITDVTGELESIAGGPGSALGSGGMATKIQAAKIAMQSGAAMVIANGDRPNVLRELLGGKRIGTLFLPQRRPRRCESGGSPFSRRPKVSS